MVMASPIQGILEPHDIAYIDVWVYGDTWGYYFDEITICIDRKESCKISLLAELVGHPVTFPTSILCGENSQPYVR